MAGVLVSEVVHHIVYDSVLTVLVLQNVANVGRFVDCGALCALLRGSFIFLRSIFWHNKNLLETAVRISWLAAGEISWTVRLCMFV